MVRTRFLTIALALGLSGLGAARGDEGPGTAGEPAPVEPGLRRWEARVGLGEIRDSNPTLLSEELALSVPDSRKTVRGGESDRAGTADLHFAAYPWQGRQEESAPGSGPGAWHTGLTFDGSHSAYQKLGFLDLSELRGAVHLARGRAPVGLLSGPLGTTRVPVGSTPTAFLVQAGVSQILLDGSPYLRMAAAAASVAWRPGNLLATQLDLEVRDLRFAEEPAVGTRSGTEARVRVAPTLFLAREDRYFRLSGLWGTRSAGKPFSGMVVRGGAELALPVASGWSLFLSGFLQRDDFDHHESNLFFSEFNPFDPNFDPASRLMQAPLRRDRTTGAAATLVWTWRERPLQVVARWSTTRRDSNLGTLTAPDALDYRRTVASVGLSWSF